MDTALKATLQRELSPRQWDVARLKWPAASLREAVDLSLQVSGKSVEALADELGLGSHWTLYKQLADLRIPLHNLLPFMNATGSLILLKWLASSADYLLVPRPRGRTLKTGEAAAVVGEINKRISRALEPAETPTRKKNALLELDAAMEAIARLRGAIETSDQPELW